MIKWEKKRREMKAKKYNRRKMGTTWKEDLNSCLQYLHIQLRIFEYKIRENSRERRGRIRRSEEKSKLKELTSNRRQSKTYDWQCCAFLLHSFIHFCVCYDSSRSCFPLMRQWTNKRDEQRPTEHIEMIQNAVLFHLKVRFNFSFRHFLFSSSSLPSFVISSCAGASSSSSTLEVAFLFQCSHNLKNIFTESKKKKKISIF